MSLQRRHLSLKPKWKINIVSVQLIFSNFCLLFQINILDKDLLFIPRSGLDVDEFSKVNSIGVT